MAQVIRPTLLSALTLLLLLLRAHAFDITDESSGSFDDGSLFDSGPRQGGSLTAAAPLMAGVRDMLPRPKLDIEVGDIDFSQVKAYGIRVGVIAGPAFVLGIVSFIVGCFFVPIRLCCSCCRKKKAPKKHSKARRRSVPTLRVLFGIIVIYGCAVGLCGNTFFSNVLGDVYNVGDNLLGTVLDLGDNATTFVGTVSSTAEELLNKSLALLDPVAGLSDLCGNLSAEIRLSRDKLDEITTAVQNLKVVTSAIRDLKVNVVPAFQTSASQSLNDVADLLDVTENQLLKVTKEAREQSEKFLAQAQNTTEGITNKINDSLDKVRDVTEQYHQYGTMALGYDRNMVTSFFDNLQCKFVQTSFRSLHQSLCNSAV
eukprot:m51a1_g1981 hypothetical protein (370) ;mRNA; f:1124131-1126361